MPNSIQQMCQSQILWLPKWAYHHILCFKYCIVQLQGRGKYQWKVYFEGMVGKHLVNLNLNKTICTYIINIAVEAREKIQCSKQSVWSSAQPCSYMCVFECVVVHMLEFTVATTSSQLLRFVKGEKVKERRR